MCGFVGALTPGSTPRLSAEDLNAMTVALDHRGPDRRSTWLDPAAGIAFGHTRLAIVDLSSCGDQPMTSQSGRYVCVFNGEIYNFRELRHILAQHGAEFRGHSDTEVMLTAFERWGITEGCKKLVGMFAVAIWDRRDRVLYLARDRFGEKPLYFGTCGETLIFGSELKALRAYPGWKPTIDRNAIALYLRHNYIPAPYSIYEGVFKAPPGKVVAFKGVGSLQKPEFSTFWNVDDMLRQRHNAWNLSDLEATDRCDELLRRSVSQQMVADVPIGAFLSGGIDSSLIVSLMQVQSASRIRTFTIGFEEAAYNEAPQAASVATHLGTDHTELYVTPEDALSVVPRLAGIYDEPFADSSQIPTFLVSRLARTEVTVSLSGDGGDELFGGYPRYAHGELLWRKITRVPTPVRGAAAWLARVGVATLGSAPGANRVSNRLRSISSVLGHDAPEMLYHEMVSQWNEPTKVAIHSEEPLTPLTNSASWLVDGDFLDKSMYLDAITYLPDDILVKVDRASMAVSLESRAPFLDHRVAEFAWSLPRIMKVRDGVGKWILRRVLERYVPEELFNRPKMGFGVPIDRWLRGPLRDWAEALLDPNKLRSEGYFDPGYVRAKWNEHQRGVRDWQYPLWGILMFESWLERELSAEGAQRSRTG